MDWNDGKWQQAGRTIRDEEEASFGASIALSSDGSRIVVGAWQALERTGYVRVYGWEDSTWKQIGNAHFGETPGDAFGGRVAISSDGSRFVVGGSGHREEAGHARVFEIA